MQYTCKEGTVTKLENMQWSLIHLKNGGKHVKISCPCCDVFIKFLNKEEKDYLREKLRERIRDS